jgi:hypothetical protein
VRKYSLKAELTVGRADLRRILMKHPAADIRPRFLQFVVHTVIQNQKSKSGGVSRRSLARLHRLDRRELRLALFLVDFEIQNNVLAAIEAGDGTGW